MITALPYHEKVLDHFKSQKKTWDYFNIASTKDEQLKQFKTELLKSTYKFSRETEPAIYEKVDLAREKLGLQDLTVVVYQSQNTDELNASIVYLNGEAHIVFSGPIIKLLTDQELLAVIAHELTHVKLYTLKNGEVEVVDRIVTAIANNYSSEASYFETARLFRLYTEIFCDRGACIVLDSIEPIITSLIKISTGLEKINAENYLKQADEIFLNDSEIKAHSVTHPENFIRARAVKLWKDVNDKADFDITKMVEGLYNLDQLDIFRQKELSVVSRKFIQLLLKPKWFQSTLVLSLAKQYFQDFTLDENLFLDEKFSAELAGLHPSIKDYLSYVILDFAMADSSLEEIPLGWAFQFSEELGLSKIYESIFKKELKLSDKKLKLNREKYLSAFYEVKENEGEQIYE